MRRAEGLHQAGLMMLGLPTTCSTAQNIHGPMLCAVIICHASVCCCGIEAYWFVKVAVAPGKEALSCVPQQMTLQ